MSKDDISLHFYGSISAQILDLLKPIIINLFFDNIVHSINS